MGRLLLFLVRVGCFRELQGNDESHANEECFLGGAPRVFSFLQFRVFFGIRRFFRYYFLRYT